MERTAYDLGDVAVLSVTFSVAGVPTDPTTVSPTVAPRTAPHRLPQVRTSPRRPRRLPRRRHQPTRRATGPTEFVGTGAAADVETGYFSVLPDPTVQNGRDLCTLEDVVARVPGYEVGDDRRDRRDARPLHRDRVARLPGETRREITPISPGSVTRVFDVDWIVCEERELLIGDAASTTAVVLKGQDGTILQTLDSSSWVELPRVREDWEPSPRSSSRRSSTTPPSSHGRRSAGALTFPTRAHASSARSPRPGASPRSRRQCGAPSRRSC
jgi:hypothetical protein